MNTKPLVIYAKIDSVLWAKAQSLRENSGRKTKAAYIYYLLFFDGLFLPHMNYFVLIDDVRYSPWTSGGHFLWVFVSRRLTDLFRPECVRLDNLLTKPIFSASASSRFIRASAASFACRSSFAVGKPVILAFSSASYFIRLSRGDTCDRSVEGLRYAADTSLCSVCA